MTELPKPVLAFCRTGMRSITMCALSQAGLMPLPQIIERVFQGRLRPEEHGAAHRQGRQDTGRGGRREARGRDHRGGAAASQWPRAC